MFMNNVEFAVVVLNLGKESEKVRFEQQCVRGKNYPVVVFNEVFACNVLSNRDGILSVEHSASSTSPQDAINAMCESFADLAKKHGIRKIKIALNKVNLTITAKSAKKPQRIYWYWYKKLV